ncbi:MAG: hypothetical protein KF734_12395 [Saprospiraceae bacterium]|nr:hypothetical protein [Saprospiraceae bacterium]
MNYGSHYTQIKEDLNLPVGKAVISLIDLHDFQRIASAVRSKPLRVDYTGHYYCAAKTQRHKMWQINEYFALRLRGKFENVQQSDYGYQLTMQFKFFTNH